MDTTAKQNSLEQFANLRKSWQSSSYAQNRSSTFHFTPVYSSLSASADSEELKLDRISIHIQNNAISPPFKQNREQRKS